MQRQILLFFSFIACVTATGQTAFNFREITVNHGLNDGHVQSIASDKYGNMWFASLGGLNRYNGQSITKFYHSSKDPHSILSELALSMCLMDNGRFFIGFANGLMEYDYSNSSFQNIEEFNGQEVNNIFSVQNTLYFLCNNQLCEYNIETKKKVVVNFEGIAPKNENLEELFLYNNQILISSLHGLLSYHLDSHKTEKLNLGPEFDSVIYNSYVDKGGYLWVNKPGKKHLFKISPDRNTKECMDAFLFDSKISDFGDFHFLSNDALKTWIVTRSSGLVEYDRETNKVRLHRYSAKETNGINSNFFMSCYADEDGGIWLGSRFGVTYFNTKKVQFKSIQVPFKEQEYQNKLLARSAAEDNNGNYWLGFQEGLVKYNPRDKTYKVWQNDGQKMPLYQNQIRYLYFHENTLWVVATRGVIKLNTRTDHIELSTGPRGGPNLQYTCFMLDEENTEWFSSVKGEGLYFRKPGGSKELTPIKEHPDLHVLSGIGMRSLFQDSKKRLWFGSFNKGVFMYEPKSKTLENFTEKGPGSNAIAGNSVIDIKEDKTGVLWVTTDQGLSGIDLEHHSVQNFTIDNGLNGSSLFSLVVDGANRLWIGTSRELLMLDAERKRFSSYGVANGLPCSEFTEYRGYTARNEEIFLGAQCGFIHFNPLEIETFSKPIRCIINDIKVDNKPFKAGDINELPQITLQPLENTIEIEFAGINYPNPAGVDYAYMMEGIDKEWTYSSNPVAKYLNLQGGTYILKYKAKDVNGVWVNNEKTLKIEIATLFYKTWWFKFLVVALLFFMLFSFYQYRTLQERKIVRLKLHAQNLEKEKTLVQYENLKQQLNPHFLFNSLASLNSLVAGDPVLARQFVDRMSRIYRYILNSSKNETVLLSQELEFADHYIKLQQTRFSEGFIVNIHVDEDALHRRIVPVTLQNLVENAIKHNIIEPESPLIIDVFVENDYLVAKNNLQRKSVVETSNKRGINQMKELYKYLSDRPILIEESPDYFCIRIPLI